MRVITTTLSPDQVPLIDGDAPFPTDLIGPEAFTIQSVWFPRDLPGLPRSWDMYSQIIPVAMSEILGGDYTAYPIPAKDLSASRLVPNEAQLAEAIRSHSRAAHGWVNLNDVTLKSALAAYRAFGLNFAWEFIQSRNIVVQQSDPSLNSLTELIAKAKERGTPLAGIYIGVQAASAATITNPVIYLLCVSGGIILCGPALAFAREIDQLTQIFMKRMLRKISPA